MLSNFPRAEAFPGPSAFTASPHARPAAPNKVASAGFSASFANLLSAATAFVSGKRAIQFFGDRIDMTVPPLPDQRGARKRPPFSLQGKLIRTARGAWLLGLGLSTLWMALLFVFANVCAPINDDKAILRSFMGFQPGGPVRFNMYVQTLLAWPLYWLSTAFPGIAWFSVIQLFFLWLGNGVIVKAIAQCFIRRGKPLWSGVLAATCCFALYSLFTTARLTYSVTAALLGAAAVAQMMSMDADTLTGRQYVRSAGLALGLLTLSYSLRSVAALPALGYCGLVFASHALRSFGFGPKRKRSLLPLGVTLAMVAAVAVGLPLLRQADINAQGQTEAVRWQDARTSVLDYLNLSAIPESVFTQADWSQTEVELLSNWYTMDSAYSTQAFETVSTLADPTQARTSAGEAILDLQTRSPTVVLSMILLLALGGCCVLWLWWYHRGKLFAPLMLLVATGLLCLLFFSYLAIQGRLPYRAALVPVMPAATLVFCLLPQCLPDRFRLCGWKGFATLLTFSILTVLTLLCVLPTAYSIRRTPSQWEYNTYEDMDHQALAHPDLLLIYDVSLVNDTRLFPDVSEGIPENLMFWGGWDRGSVEYNARLAAFGLGGEHFTARDWLNPAIRYLTLSAEPDELLLRYLREKIGADVACDVEQVSEGLYFQRFYLPNADVSP